MGLLDYQSRVLTTFKADTSEMKAKLKELTGVEKERAEAELKAAEGRNKSSDDYVDRLGKISLAVDGVTRAAQAGFEGLKEYGRRLNLENAAGSVSIDRLAKAAGGLHTNMQLLEHAAVFNQSAFRLTEDQMVSVEGAMVALEKRGRSSTEVWEAVSKAITEGATDGLEGVLGPLEKSTGAVEINSAAVAKFGDKALAVDAALKQLARTANGVADGQVSAADRVTGTTVSLENAMDSMKQSLGQIVIALEPLVALVAKLADAASWLTDRMVKGFATIGDTFNYSISFEERQKRIADRFGLDIAEYAKQGDLVENHLAGGGNIADLISSQMRADAAAADGSKPDVVEGWKTNPLGGISNLWYRAEQVSDQLLAMGDEKIKKIVANYKAGQQRAAQIAEERRKLANTLAKSSTDELVARLEAEISESNADAASRQRAAGFWGATGDRDDFTKAIDAAMASWEGDYYRGGSKGGLAARQAENYDIARRERGQSFLEETFGTLAEFNAYKTAFDSLTGATSAALGAWIDGSMSAGQAFKSFIADALKSLASQMLIESLKHAAYALGSLAFGDVKGAGLHAAAAAAFGAGAGVAAIASRELGGGAKAGGGTSASPSAPNTSASASGATPSQSIIVIGDSFADDTPRMRQQRAQQLVGRAIGTNAVVYA